MQRDSYSRIFQFPGINSRKAMNFFKILFYFIVFISGLCIGSFLNVVLFRKSPDSQKRQLSGRSFCPNCKKTLAWHELIPLLSFFILKKRCLKCKKPISWQYPFVEFFTGVLFVAVSKYAFDIYGLKASCLIIILLLCIIVSFFILLFVYDLKYLVLPNSFLYLSLFFVLFYKVFLFVLNNFDFKVMLGSLGAALIAGGFFAFLVFISNEQWMGIGDIFLGIIIGILSGWPNVLVSLFFAFVSGGVIGVLLVLSKQKAMKSRVPFGPFLLAGALFGMFFGDKIIRWYL